MDEASLQRRLQKALHVVDKLKKKEVFEQEVNKELAKRNEVLKRQVQMLEWKLLEISKAISKVDECFGQVEGVSGEPDLETLPTLRHEWNSLKCKVLQRTPLADEVQHEEIATSMRPKSRKRSSMFFKVPELMGAQHSRRSTELAETAPVSSSQDISQPATSEHSLSSLFQAIPSSSAQAERTPSQVPFLFDVNFNLNESGVDLSKNVGVPLFEHFIVVGAPSEVAHDFAQQLVNFDGDSLSNRLKKTFGFLNSPIIGGRSNSGGAFPASHPPKNPETPKRTPGPGAAQIPVDGNAVLDAVTPVRLLESGPGPMLADKGRTKSVELPVDEAPASSSRGILSLFSSRVSQQAKVKRSISMDAGQDDAMLPNSTSASNSSNLTEFEALVDLVCEQDRCEENKTKEEPNSATTTAGTLPASSTTTTTTTIAAIATTTTSITAPLTTAASTSFVGPVAGVGMGGTVPSLSGDLNLSTASGKMAEYMVAGGNALSRFGGAMFSKLSKGNSMSQPLSISTTMVTMATTTTTTTAMTTATAVAGTPATAPSHTAEGGDTLSVDDNESESSYSQPSPAPANVSSDFQDGVLSLPSEATESASAAMKPILNGEPVFSNSSISNPTSSAPAKLLQCDKRIGSASAQAQVIYHFPPDRELPPQEVSDFCLPLGGKLQRLSNNKDEDSMVKEILFGHTHSKRNERCYIFLLEDKTLETEEADEESGQGVSKLYAICVAFPRLLRTTVQPSPQTGSQAAGAPQVTDFESMVCYAFLTRFPLFDLFFQIIFDLISCERLQRMERVAQVQDTDFKASRQMYEYVPRDYLDCILSKLTLLPPPKFNHTLRFTLYSGFQPIEHHRAAPLGDLPEYSLRAGDWCLPPMLFYLPPDLVVWTLSLLLSEAKVLVVGHEIGMVSCAVTGLLLLLRPLEWVSPVIPLLPTKMMDFIESPVPILAGILLDSDAGQKALDIQHILHVAGQDDAIVTAVLDVSAKELYLPASFSSAVNSLSLPDADVLTSRLSAYSSTLPSASYFGNTGPLSLSAIKTTKHKGLYSLSAPQRDSVRCMQEIIATHIAAVAKMASDTYERVEANGRAATPDDIFKELEEVEATGGDGWKVASEMPEEQSANLLGPLVEVINDESADCGKLRDQPNAIALLDLYAKIISEEADAQSHSPTPSSASSVSNVIAIQKKVALFSLSGQSHGSHSSVICLHRDLFMDADEDLFMQRFIKTQIFAEYRNAVSAVDVVPSEP